MFDKYAEFNNLLGLNYKIYEVVFNKEENIVVFRVHYINDDFSPEHKTVLAAKIAQKLQLQSVVEVKAKKYYLDSDVLKTYLNNFLKANYFSVHSQINMDENISINKVENAYSCDLMLLDSQIEYLKANNFENVFNSYFSSIFFDDIYFNFVPHASLINTEQLQVEKLRKMEEFMNAGKIENKIKLKSIKITENIVGKINAETAFSIDSFSTSKENVCVAGTVNYITQNKYTPKREKEKPNPTQRDYFTFELLDNLVSCRCVMFPKSADVEKILQLQNGDVVALLGDVQIENGRVNFKVKNIALAEISQLEEEQVKKSANKNYLYVSPEPYVSLEQTNFFAVKEQYSQFIMNNEFVVFDVETTGIDYSVEDIIEIGAVKLKQGKIVESFSCLVKPTKQISSEITNITGITDEMVAQSRSITEVMHDFYKFAENCVLVAYNIDFDYKFISKTARLMGYKFDNEQIDALYLARVNIPGLKNYKLKTVAETLNVSLENAHRALNDTVATAKIFLKLSDYIKV